MTSNNLLAQIRKSKGRSLRDTAIYLKVLWTFLLKKNALISIRDTQTNVKQSPWRQSLYWDEALPGGGGWGGPMSPVWILKRLVSVFINACRLLSALPSLSQFGRGRLSLVAISFYAPSLLFEPCRLSEFTLAGPLRRLSKKSWSTVSNAALRFKGQPLLHDFSSIASCTFWL